MLQPADPEILSERALEKFEKEALDRYLAGLRAARALHAAYATECENSFENLVRQAAPSHTGRLVGAAGFWVGVGWSVWSGDVFGVVPGVIATALGAYFDQRSRIEKERAREPERARLIDALSRLARVDSGIDAAQRVYGLKGWSTP